MLLLLTNNICNWNISNVKNTTNMFIGAIAFNGVFNKLNTVEQGEENNSSD